MSDGENASHPERAPDSLAMGRAALGLAPASGALSRARARAAVGAVPTAPFATAGAVEPSSDTTRDEVVAVCPCEDPGGSQDQLGHDEQLNHNQDDDDVEDELPSYDEAIRNCFQQPEELEAGVEDGAVFAAAAEAAQAQADAEAKRMDDVQTAQTHRAEDAGATELNVTRSALNATVIQRQECQPGLTERGWVIEPDVQEVLWELIECLELIAEEEAEMEREREEQDRMQAAARAEAAATQAAADDAVLAAAAARRKSLVTPTKLDPVPEETENELEEQLGRTASGSHQPETSHLEMGGAGRLNEWGQQQPPWSEVMASSLSTVKVAMMRAGEKIGEAGRRAAGSSGPSSSSRAVASPGAQSESLDNLPGGGDDGGTDDGWVLETGDGSSGLSPAVSVWGGATTDEVALEVDLERKAEEMLRELASKTVRELQLGGGRGRMRVAWAIFKWTQECRRVFAKLDASCATA